MLSTKFLFSLSYPPLSFCFFPSLFLSPPEFFFIFSLYFAFSIIFLMTCSLSLLIFLLYISLFLNVFIILFSWNMICRIRNFEDIVFLFLVFLIVTLLKRYQRNGGRERVSAVCHHEVFFYLLGEKSIRIVGTVFSSLLFVMILSIWDLNRKYHKKDWNIWLNSS